jgi:TolB-like protein/DNA-binding winged helix-turn-helix (wHTH) protein/Tfp pilus assembly protein PilF
MEYELVEITVLHSPGMLNMAGSDQSRTVRFGLFELDVRSGELRKNGVKIKLQDQPFRVLTTLLQHANEVVTREELRRQLWPEDTFVDFDHSLNASIKRLRDALGESAERPVFIETLARRGYRFIAPVKVHPMPEAVEAHALQPAITIPTMGRRHFWTMGGIAVATMVLLAGLTWERFGRQKSEAGESGIASLVVLPLENLSKDPEQEYFSDGMTDALITQLSKTGALRVTSRTSAMRYKGTKKSLPEIAKELNVDVVIEGSVMRSGNRVRIAAQLVRARTDQHVWAETYERDLGDVFRLQSEVAQAVAQQVRLQLTPEQQTRLRSEPVVNSEAYEAYLKGNFYRYATGTQAALRQSKAYYEEAVRKDPEFALAYAGLAECYLDLGAFRLVPPQEAYRHGSEAVHKALQLDQALSEAHTSLGYLDWQYDWDWQAAEKELRYAVDLNPNYIEGHETLVWYFGWSGRPGEALAEVEKIRQLDPAYPFIFLDESGIYYHQRDYKSLVEVGQKSVGANPSGWSNHYLLAVGYEGSGRPAQAVPEYQQAVELSQGDSDAAAGLAHAYATMGRMAEAEKILGELQRQSKVSYVSPYMMAAIYSGLGQREKAFEFLEKAYDERSPDVAYFLRADLRMDTLRADPRFRDLMHRIGLPQTR